MMIDTLRRVGYSDTITLKEPAAGRKVIKEMIHSTDSKKKQMPGQVVCFIKKHKLLISVVMILLYILVGAMAPFAMQKSVSDGENIIRKEDFYAGENDAACPDRAHVVEDNTEALSLRLRMINEARDRIILSTFDFREDESTWDLGAALYEAAERGVDVKILVDGISGLIRMEGKPFFYALASHPNIEIRIYNYPNPLKPWTINGRMHDKYVISDQKTLLLGGRNTFRYFLGDYETDDRSHDREAFLYNTDYPKGAENSVISQVESYFCKVWNGDHITAFHDSEKLQRRPRVRKCIALLTDRREELRTHYPQSYGSYSYEEHTVPIKKATLISGETGIYGKKPLVWDTLQKLMASAENRVILHTPYAVLDKQMEAGMKEISENVKDFSMVLNSIENGDNVVASSDYRLHRKDIIDTGVQLYEFDGGDSTHGKSILIDNDLSIIGSYNLDMRSTYMDTELMLAIQSEELSNELETYMDTFRQNSRKILTEKTYDLPPGVTITPLPLKKKILYSILGPLFQPIRCIA